MGEILITENTSLNIANYSLRIGDKIVVTCVGGGGGGGGTTSNGSNAGGVFGFGSSGAGGSSGGTYHCRGQSGQVGQMISKPVILDQEVIPITVGACGTGGYGNYTQKYGDNGTAGGSTSFGTYVTAAGGAGGTGGVTNLNNTTTRAYVFGTDEAAGKVGYISPGVIAHEMDSTGMLNSSMKNGCGAVWIQW